MHHHSMSVRNVVEYLSVLEYILTTRINFNPIPDK